VNIPFVVMNRVLHNAGTIQVGFDNHQDALELMDALFAHHCTHPLLLSHRFHNSEIKDRERGFLESLWNRGVSNPKDTIIRLPDGSDSSTLQLDFLCFLKQELTSRPEIDALVAVDDHILKLLQMVVQSGSLFEEHPVTLSGFGTVDDVFSTGSIDIYQHQNPASLVEVAIAHLLDIINNRSLGITQIIRIPSILTFGSKTL